MEAHDFTVHSLKSSVIIRPLQCCMHERIVKDCPARCVKITQTSADLRLICCEEIASTKKGMQLGCKVQNLLECSLLRNYHSNFHLLHGGRYSLLRSHISMLPARKYSQEISYKIDTSEGHATSIPAILSDVTHNQMLLLKLLYQSLFMLAFLQVKKLAILN